jgi:putative transposase
MPRRPRVPVPGGIYHVTSRGNRREPIFVNDGDRILFLEILSQIIARRSWRLFAYCLMQNHYHAVVQTPDADLAAGMRALNGDYAQWFNKLYGLVGHVFQGRYHAVLVESDWHFLELSRYLAMNPVRAGLCSAPRDWPWGSYRIIIGEESSALVSADRTLRHFGRNSGVARAAFSDFVEGQLVQDGRSAYGHVGA